MEMKTDVRTYLSLYDDYNRIHNEQIVIIASSGGGKTFASEGVVEKFYKNGYIIFIIADPKREVEFGFQMFEPEERYHLNLLSRWGVFPNKKKIKLYHPFTFNIPKEKLPDINFFTFSLKELGRKEWSIIAETDWDTETMRLLLQASENISNEDGIYSLLHYIQEVVKGKSEGKKKKPDPKTFYLESGSGTMKSVAEISSYLQPFKKDYFLVKDNCFLNFKWKEVLLDQEHYHVFMYNWIKDEKIRDFVVLALLEGILRHKDILKRPVLVVIPEIRRLCPFKPQGHKMFLAESIKDSMSLMRSSGRGMSSLLDSQVWEDVDEDVRNSATETFFGKIGGGSDMEKIAKAYNYKRDTRDQLKKPDESYSFLRVGHEDVGGWTFTIPTSMHGEEQYKFFEHYKKNYPEKMKSYAEIVKTMQEIYKKEENKIKERIDKREKIQKEESNKKQKEKEIEKTKDDKVEEIKKEVKVLKDKSKEEIIKKCLDMYSDGKKFREIGRELGISHNTVRKYVEKNKDKYGEQKDKELEKDYKEEFDEFNERFEEKKDVPLLGEDFELPDE